MAAEFEHLPLDVRPIAGLDAEARIAHIRAERWVQHAAADRVLGYLQEALVQPPKDRMENILLIGESGMGKTMLVRKFERQNAARFDDVAGLQRRPVVTMLMPHHPTEARFTERASRSRRTTSRVSPDRMSRNSRASTGRLRSAPEACSSNTVSQPAARSSSSCGSVPWSSVETLA